MHVYVYACMVTHLSNAFSFRSWYAFDMRSVFSLSRYVSRLFVKCSGKPSEILTKLNELAGFAPEEEIEIFEVCIPFRHIMVCNNFVSVRYFVMLNWTWNMNLFYLLYLLAGNKI